MPNKKFERKTVTASSIDEDSHPISNMISYGMPAAPVKPVAEKKAQANFKIEPELLEDFKILCKINHSDLSKQIVAFISETVKENRDKIEKHKNE